MSQILTRSPKHCAQRGFHSPKLNKKLIYTFSTILLSILSFILLLYLTLHPTKPNFTLLQAQIYQLNLSNPSHLLSSSLQLTLESKNPNTKVGVYYDELVAYASYKGQPITTHISIPPFFQDKQESNVFSTSLGATGLPVAPSFGFDVARDQVAGRLVVAFKVDGRLRWKIGSWVSGRYRIDVDCVAVLPIGVTAPRLIGSAGQGSHCATSGISFNQLLSKLKMVDGWKSANAASGMAVDDECKLKFQELKSKRSFRFITYKISDQQVGVDKIGDHNQNYDDFTNSLPPNECRYAVFDFDFTTSENVQKSKIVFIAWSPDTSNVRMKMVYASSKDRFKRELEGIQVEIQATDPSEMSLDIVQGRAF